MEVFIHQQKIGKVVNAIVKLSINNKSLYEYNDLLEKITKNNNTYDIIVVNILNENI